MSSAAITARRHAPLAILRPLLARLQSWIWGALDAAIRAHARRRDERFLLAQPDYLLHDLGIARADVPRVVREGR
jgi:uncharacterized protein YjiS (DUF1127 family)